MTPIEATLRLFTSQDDDTNEAVGTLSLLNPFTT